MGWPRAAHTRHQVSICALLTMAEATTPGQATLARARTTSSLLPAGYPRQPLEPCPSQYARVQDTQMQA